MFAGRNNDNGFWPCTGLQSKTLVIPELKAHNQFTVDAIQGSVPSSPSDETGDYAPTALDMDTQEIIDTFLKIFTGLPHSKSGRKQVLSTMKRVVDALAVKHELAYKGMIARLNLEQKGEDVSFIKQVATELFSDGTTNWGRIASLLTFGAMLCKYQNDRGHSKYVVLVGEEISSYLLTEQRDWILRNKAWDGFVEFFHVPDTEAAVRNTLLTIGGVATLSAALAYWIR